MRQSYRAAAFVAATCIYSWGVWLALLAAARTGLIERQALGSLYAFGGAGPSLAALLLVWRAEGGQGLAAFAKRPLAWRAPLRWYAFALLLPFALRLLAVILHSAFGGAGVPITIEFPALFIGFVFALIVPLMEEYGWRGYLQPALRGRTTAVAAGALVGVAWAVWHFPLFWFPGTGFSRWAEISGHVPAMAGYTASVISLALLFALQHERTSGNLWLAFLLHDAMNTSSDVFFGPYNRAGIVGPTWWFVGLLALSAAIAAWRLRRPGGAPTIVPAPAAQPRG